MSIRNRKKSISLGYAVKIPDYLKKKQDCSDCENLLSGVCSKKQLFLGRSSLSGTSYVLREYEVDGNDSPLCRWNVEAQL